MNTVPDLMDAYRDLVDHAPTVTDLQLTPPDKAPARRGTTLRPVLAVLVAVLAVVGLGIYVRGHAAGRHEPPAATPQPRWPDSYQFGPDSLPGYSMTRTDLQALPGVAAASTTHTYARRSENHQATLTLRRESQLGRYRNGTPVTVNGKHGYYVTGSASLPPRLTRPASVVATPDVHRPRPPLVPALSSAIVWPISKDSWAVLTLGPGSITYKNGVPERQGGVPSPAAMVQLAESVRAHESATTAPVKVGYLPAGLELTSVQQFLDSPVDTFDDRFGRSYRDLMFTDRSVSQTEVFSLDIGVLVAPQKPLALKDLPDARTVRSGNWSPTPYDPAKQWTQRMISGHRAFVSAHAVIIDWGGVEVHVTNEQLHFAVTPILSQAELIRIAASLTVPSSGTVGNGYPLNQAVPAAHRQ